MITYKLKPHLNRIAELYSLDDSRVPKSLFSACNELPDLQGFAYPLPFQKKDCIAVVEFDNALWYGARGKNGGVVRFDVNAEREIDKLMYFSASRYLPDNDVKKMLVVEDALWVLCDSGAARLQMKELSAFEKAEILLKESIDIVDRRGMISQRRLNVAGFFSTAVPYGESDNDGGFTAAYTMGVIFRYLWMKDEYGFHDERTIAARAVAMRSLEACLLLMNISGRGDGFVARTYLTVDEPVPDGLFYKKNGDTAECIVNPTSIRRGYAGKQVTAAASIPSRLTRLYESEGYSHDDIIYKGDTSSDEITLHFMLMFIAYEYFCEDDDELRKIIVDSITATMNHIIDSGFVLREFDGQSTTWAKWNEEYFNSEEGYVDACLNSAELLMYLKVTAHLNPENKKWQETYDMLVKEKGYARLTTLHYDRFVQACTAMGVDCAEELMYGDNMLAMCSFWGLLSLETDPELVEVYKKALSTWRHSFDREDTPGYLLPLNSVCPEFEIDIEAIVDWLYRTNCSRLAAGATVEGRHDVPCRLLQGGGKETGWLLEPDERFISKYDRDPLCYQNEDSGGRHCVESCYVYTFAYWFGKYFGYFE